VTRDLDHLRELVALACTRMPLPADPTELEGALAAVETCFDALARRPDAALIEELRGLERSMQAVARELPLPLRDLPRKFVPGAQPVKVWARVSSRFSSCLRDLHYAVLTERNQHACDCLVLVELRTTRRKPRSPRLRAIGTDYDGYYNGDGYACDECATRWWHGTHITESEHVELWEPRAPTWTPST